MLMTRPRSESPTLVWTSVMKLEKTTIRQAPAATRKANESGVDRERPNPTVRRP